MKKPRKQTIKVVYAITIICFLILLLATPVQAVEQTGAWYFDNLTPEDRLNIRKAIDYAIPRDQIIEEVLHGLGVKIASPIEANDGAYDPSITARDYNTTKALELMTVVFGYEYDEGSIDETAESYFSMDLIIPLGDEMLIQWASLISSSLTSIGIDVRIRWLNWNIIIPRIFAAPVGVGFEWEHGGFDGFVTGWAGSPESDVSQWFRKENWPPYGNNIGYINNSEVDEILDRVLNSPALIDQLSAFKEFQVWFKDNLPYFLVLQPIELWVRDPELNGVSYGFDYPNYGNWTHDTDDVVTIQSPGNFINMNPFIARSYYDKLALKGIYDTLLQRFPDDPNTYYGNLAEDWITSEDRLKWTFSIREGIKFSDGSDMTVDDVVLSYQKFIEPSVNVIGGTNLATYLNKTNIVKVNETSVQFTLNTISAYMEELIGTIPVLSKTQMINIPDTEWATDQGTNTKYAPLGTGPYVMDENNTNIAGGNISLELNSYYNDSVRDSAGHWKL